MDEPLHNHKKFKYSKLPLTLVLQSGFIAHPGASGRGLRDEGMSAMILFFRSGVKKSLLDNAFSTAASSATIRRFNSRIRKKKQQCNTCTYNNKRVKVAMYTHLCSPYFQNAMEVSPPQWCHHDHL